MTTSDLFFLEEIDAWGLGILPGMEWASYIDLNLTDYKLNHPKIQEVIQPLSPKRLIHTENCAIWPGHGEGIAILDKIEYRIDYAWKGLCESSMEIGSKNHLKVLNWAVRLSPVGNKKIPKKNIDAFVKGIFLDEGGQLETKFLRGEWFKKVVKCNPPTVEGYKNMLEKEAKKYHRERANLSNNELARDNNELARGIRAMGDKAYSQETIDKRIEYVKNKKIITVRNSVSIKECYPWKVFQK